MTRKPISTKGLALLLLLLAAACSGKTGAGAAPGARPPPMVAVAAAVQRDIPVYLDQIGRCVASEVVSIRPQVSGQVTKIHFVDGAPVKRGQLLFSIDRRPLEAELQSARAGVLRERAALQQSRATLAQRRSEVVQLRADLARDRARMKNARGQLGRNEQLANQKLVTPDQLDRVRTNYVALRSTVAASRARIETNKATVAAAQAAVQSAQAAIRVAEASVASARLRLGYASIHSPIDGRAGRRLVDVGNVVNAANPGEGGVMLVIQRLDPIYVDFTIAEKDLTSVQASLAAGTAKVEVRIPDEPKSVRTGRLTFLDSSVQEGSGTVKLRATLNNADHRFWPGRFVKVRLVLRTLSGAVLVPLTAPQTSSKGSFVYVVRADSKAELRPVVLGSRYGNLVAVSKGVAAGERVVTAGQLAVRPGGPVRIEGAPGPSQGKKPGAAKKPGGGTPSGAKKPGGATPSGSKKPGGAKPSGGKKP